MGKPSSYGGKGSRDKYWTCEACGGWTYCRLSMQACHGCQKPPSKAAARHFPAASTAAASPGAPAAPRRGWAATPRPLAEFITVQRGSKAQRKARAALSSSEPAAPSPAAGAGPGAPQVAAAGGDVVDLDATVPALSIADVRKNISNLEAFVVTMPHLPHIAAALAVEKESLVTLLAAQRASKPPAWRLVEASRKEKQCEAKEAKSAQVLVDLAAAHELLVVAHRGAMAAAQAVLAADKQLTAVAKQESSDAAAATQAASPPPVGVLSAAAELLAENARVANAALAAQIAADAAPPPPGDVPPAGSTAAPPAGDVEMQAREEQEQKDEEARNEKRQREIDDKLASDAHENAELADAEAAAKRVKLALSGANAPPHSG
jgi:hypothetical protein